MYFLLFQIDWNQYKYNRLDQTKKNVDTMELTFHRYL